MLADSKDAADDATTMATTLNNQEMAGPTKGYHCILYHVHVYVRYIALCIIIVSCIQYSIIIQYTVYLL